MDVQASRGDQWIRVMRLLLIWLAFSGAVSALASAPDETHSAASLHAKYAALGERLQRNPYGRALYLDSVESASDLKGDIYALVDYPFRTVSTALNGPENWCDVLILHVNTKHCSTTTDQGRTVLTVSIGKKPPQPLSEAFPIEFFYHPAMATAKYLDIQLDAQEGPLSTRNYRIQLQAVPVGNSRTFLHLAYSYDYGMAGRLAMQTYLATLGSGKVGFTLTGRQPGGQPEHIGGMRGVVERNTMRYYLAIDAYLGALSAPPSVRLQKRLHSWFSATEEYPRQLHEISRTAYMEMKRNEYLRQQMR